VRADRRAVLERFEGLRILVLGDAMLDRYLRGTADRLCREAPVPIVGLTSVTEAAGGAANVAANLASLGAGAVLLSAIGDDPEGEALLRCLLEAGANARRVEVESGRRTLAKQRVLAGSQLLLRFDQGDTHDVAHATETSLLRSLEAEYPACDAIVISDYAYGVMTPALLSKLESLHAARPKPVYIDAKDLPRYASLRPTAVKPNYAEALALAGGTPSSTTPERLRQVQASASGILNATGAEMALITLDLDGCVLVSHDGTAHMACARPMTSARGAGAGDACLAAFAAAHTAGAEPDLASDIAALAAALAVSRDGTALCDIVALRTALEAGTTVLDRQAMLSRLEGERRRGKRIVFTNGCFDILHSGHTAFLREARSLGDVLVVGLNSDESARRLKGNGRPVNPLDDRASVLLALDSVDYVLPFDEDTPEALIERVRPDVFVKGGDYRRDDLPEAALVESLGGVVRILGYLEDHSTTAIIERASQRTVLA
jgi:D-beta-D-heptose 7-phosphate kinase/D-beta-D-heptose 1-phosphate adenosyltransferase